MMRLCAGQGAWVALRSVHRRLYGLAARSSSVTAISGIGPSGVALYVDGSCKFNQRVGEVTREAGWGVVCLSIEECAYEEKPGNPVLQRHLRPLPGGELWGPVVLDTGSALHLAAEYGSNNTAELSAIGEALHWLLEHRPLFTTIAASNGAERAIPAVLFHDSEYAANVAAGRLNAHKNVALVRNVRDLLDRVKISGYWNVMFEHVRSHSDDFWNDRADVLAKHGATGALCSSTSRLSTARASESNFRKASADIVAAKPPPLPPLPPPVLLPRVLPMQHGNTQTASDAITARGETPSYGHSNSHSNTDGYSTRLQTEFNSRVRRETDFNGRAMVKLKLTQTYRQFLRSVSGDAPLPPWLAYNAELHILTQKTQHQHTQCCGHPPSQW